MKRGPAPPPSSRALFQGLPREPGAPKPGEESASRRGSECGPSRPHCPSPRPGGMDCKKTTLWSDGSPLTLSGYGEGVGRWGFGAQHLSRGGTKGQGSVKG